METDDGRPVFHPVDKPRPPYCRQPLADRDADTDDEPHALGRIVTGAPRAGGAMPTFALTIAIENDAAARAGFPHLLSIDCYRTMAEAEKWHAVDEAHVAKHGYGRIHWT